ncbi:hypothetical protein R3P38DRAFT_3553372 [Favolaschia claudopus]|uniref:Uncharacterized protein n=1 Tax=Favolaschia claudopus TaxID=2862362 RepID=A0AAW0B271_9AGAR
MMIKICCWGPTGNRLPDVSRLECNLSVLMLQVLAPSPRQLSNESTTFSGGHDLDLNLEEQEILGYYLQAVNYTLMRAAASETPEEPDGGPCKKCVMLGTATSDVDRAVIRIFYRVKLSVKAAHWYMANFNRRCVTNVVRHSVKCCQAFATYSDDSQRQLLQSLVPLPKFPVQPTKLFRHSQVILHPNYGILHPASAESNLVKATAAKIGMSGIGTGSTAKSKQYVQEMKDKREEGRKVKFNVTLSKSVLRKGGGTTLVMVRGPFIPDVKFVQLFDDSEPIDMVMEAIVLKEHGYILGAITTANLALLSSSDTTEGTAHGFLRLFRDQGYIQDGVFKSKQVFIRLVVKGSDLESDSQFMSMDSAIPASRAAASRRPPASATSKDVVLLSQPSVRKSAYIPRRVSQIPDISPPRFMRNPPTYVAMFKRYVSSINKKGQTCFSLR